jgi:anti-anti-sigma factor
VVRDQLSTELKSGSPPVLYVRGELDVSTGPELVAALDRASATEPTFVLDMAGVSFVDVAGLRVLVAAAGRRNGLGPLTIVNAPRVVSWLLDLVDLRAEPSIDLRGGTAGDVS